MEILYARNSQNDPENRSTDETDLLKAKGNTDSEITAERLLLVKKLISGVEDGNKDIVKSLLDELFLAKSSKSDTNYEHDGNIFEIWRDAMYIAMEKDTKDSEEILKLLLNCDIICSLETKIYSLLLCTLMCDETKVGDKNRRLIEILLKSGQINVNARDTLGNTALCYAHEEKLASLLIGYGADVNEKNNEGMTKLMPKFGIMSVSVLQTIVKEPRTLVDLDAIDCKGQTALMIAAYVGLPDVVELLLNAGASVNLSDHLGFTALHHATLYAAFDDSDHFPRNSEELRKRKEIFTFLYDATDEQSDWYRKYEGHINNKKEVVNILLQRPDIDVNALSFEKFSPLDIAEGWIPKIPSSFIKAMQEKGAVLNVFRETETESRSDFHLDARCRIALQRFLRYVRGNTEVGVILTLDLFEKRLLSLIEAFHEQIASGKDQQGRTALHLVAISFSVMYIGGFRNDDDENDERALANTIVNKLITIGCNINETDIYGRTPLHYADFILKDSFISHGADALIKDKDGNTAIDEIPHQSSTESSDIAKAVIDRNDETYLLRLINNKHMEIEVSAYDRECWLKTVPKLLWEKGDYAFRHPLVKHITKEVTDLVSAIAEEIERLDPRFTVRPEFVGSSNEGSKIDKPDEFDFCLVLTKISEFCEVYLTPELPNGFVRLKRRSRKVDEESDFDSFFGKDDILNTEKLKWQYTTLLGNALVNIENQQSLDCNLEMLKRDAYADIEKRSTIQMTKPLYSISVEYILIDVVPCIHVGGWWPDEAISNVSDDIKNSGCNLIFDRPQELYEWAPYSDSCARISFAKAESDMIKQSCHNAREAYMIGKTMIEKSVPDDEMPSKYTLKNSLLYCIEALTPTIARALQLGLSLEEMEYKFHQMDRYVWLKCLMKCRLEFVSQDSCPCYFLPNFCSIRKSFFPNLRENAYEFYRCTSNAISETCCKLPAPDPFWERFDRKQLIASLCEIAYNNLEL